jgi:hypothetical protein
MGARLAFQMKLMASFETRAHPCDAGYGGMLGDPWIAWPAQVK